MRLRALWPQWGACLIASISPFHAEIKCKRLDYSSGSKGPFTADRNMTDRLIRGVSHAGNLNDDHPPQCLTACVSAISRANGPGGGRFDTSCAGPSRYDLNRGHTAAVPSFCAQTIQTPSISATEASGISENGGASELCFMPIEWCVNRTGPSSHPTGSPRACQTPPSSNATQGLAASQLRGELLEVPQQVAKTGDITRRSVANVGRNCKPRHGGGSRIAWATSEFPLVGATETRCIREADIVSNRRNLDGGRGIAQHGVCLEQPLLLNIVSDSNKRYKLERETPASRHSVAGPRTGERRCRWMTFLTLSIRPNSI